MARVVEATGATAMVVQDVIEAADIATKRRFHCVIVDLRLESDPEEGPFSGELLLERLWRTSTVSD